MAIATQLDTLNHSRREIEGEMKQQAFKALDDILQTQTKAAVPAALCLYNKEWHEGVIGILASRIKEHFHRPVIAFASAKEGMLKGSARSIAGLHLRDVLDEVSKLCPGLIEKFGGHAMAAGLTIQQSSLKQFEAAFIRQVEQHLTEDKLQNILLTDGCLNSNELNLTTAELIQNAGPWGQLFPEPVFEGVFEVVNKRIVGEKHLKMLLRNTDSGDVIDAIAFNTLDTDWPVDTEKVKTVYRLDINEFRGNRTAQLMIEYIEPVVN